MKAHYYAWYPIWNPKNRVVSIYLSPGMQRQKPIGELPFFQALLRLVGVEAKVVGWSAKPFWTSYFSGAELEECWNALISLPAGSEEPGPADVIGAKVMTAATVDDAPPKYMSIVVIADFAGRADANDCRQRIKQRTSDAQWDEIHYGNTEIRKVRDGWYQLVINIATTTTDDRRGVYAAQTAMADCEQRGGTVTAREAKLRFGT